MPPDAPGCAVRPSCSELAALQARERAQQVFDAAHDPGDEHAQANARTLAQGYDASGRMAEARALRDRYGLPATP
jgi:YD repeat-containing protein